MREKKIRGKKRKTKQMLAFMEEATEYFPTEFYGGYWNYPLPVGQSFITSDQISFKIKRLCMQTLIDRAWHLAQQKPKGYDFCRVIAFIHRTDLWRSEIIVFKDEDYYSKFFDRNGDDYKWRRLNDERDITRELNLLKPESFRPIGFDEFIMDEDKNEVRGEIWVVGEMD
ncbi:DUF3916 domain-containing protein [Jeotgalibacillus haloalkalitolerans]|uniref:DUF3916 domain-containing protein n=1 Tax=Jeotgalibacillus haloalkalitolerans TaxID=3104292 RepID=A0ABU5KJE3_9BACL|nr:DUF3916 domain-containing protein [Jeotgalibacillus sp. HH7-29]MDZ5711380.1 DUF3916 domain-containing protein [Jeotgalibacillus sp. HH7-29]